METKDLKITANEAQVLINLLDIANRARGIEVAESCLFFTKKLQETFKEQPKSETKVEEVKEEVKGE